MSLIHEITTAGEDPSMLKDVTLSAVKHFPLSGTFDPSILMGLSPFSTLGERATLLSDRRPSAALDATCIHVYGYVGLVQFFNPGDLRGLSMNEHIKSVELKRAFRLINHGPTVLVSARDQGVDDVMAAAWCCGLDIDPPKLTVVIDKIARTRELMEASGLFVVQVPTVAQLALTRNVGTRTLRQEPNKLADSGVTIFEMSGHDLPFVEGCAAWLVCKRISEPHIEDTYDLFIAEIIAAWADDRVFRDGHWHFETADPQWRTLHHVAGGHFYAIGDALLGQ